MPDTDRRGFIKTSALGCAVALAARAELTAADKPAAKMRYGLVTYMWGAKWDLPTLIANCEKSGVLGVELRTTHRHGVEPSLSATARKEVKRRFADSPVTLAGLGSNYRFDSPDAKALRADIEGTKAFVKLSRDVGSSGVKVKPNDLPKGVPVEKTIEQIGKSLNEVGRYAADFGQGIRLEVHGGCARLPIMKQIMDVADHPSVAVCWNSNRQDLQGKGLEHNFNLVKDRFGATLHVRELDSKSYPHAKLIGLLLKMKYKGWVMLEASSRPKDPVAALARQQKLFEKMTAG